MIAATADGGERRSVGRILGGLALLLPMTITWLVALVLPTLQTLALSLQNVRLGREGQWVGIENYRRLFSDGVFAQASGFNALLTVERALIVAIVPPLLALALNEFGRATRIPLRLLFTLPLALFAPAMTALIWSLAYNARAGIFGGGAALSNVGQARGAILRMDALVTFGLACGIGLIVYLIALRGPGATAPRGGRVRRSFLIVWGITICATIALANQIFTPILVLTGGGPANRTATLGFLEYSYGFRNLQLGLGAAVATLLALLPALLGVAVAVVVAASGLRLTTVPANKPVGLLSRTSKPLAILALGLIGLAAIGACAYGLLPTLWSGLTSLKPAAEVLSRTPTFFPAAPTLAAYERAAQALPGGRLWFNTLAPPALGILLFQLPVAYLGALGIGALRPLGRWSEWLLLPFAPWLFITALPLGIANFERLRGAGGLNSFVGLIPPSVAAVPLLFILTLGFKGGAAAWREARAAGQPAGSSFLATVVLPSLPLAAVLALAAIVVAAQDPFWPLLVATRPEQQTIPVALIQLAGRASTDLPLTAAAVWRFGLPGGVLLFFFLALFQIFYFDRLALVTGPSEPVSAEAVESATEPVETAV